MSRATQSITDCINNGTLIQRMGNQSSQTIKNCVIEGRFIQSGGDQTIEGLGRGWYLVNGNKYYTAGKPLEVNNGDVYIDGVCVYHEQHSILHSINRFSCLVMVMIFAILWVFVSTVCF